MGYLLNMKLAVISDKMYINCGLSMSIKMAVIADKMYFSSYILLPNKINNLVYKWLVA